MNTDTFYMLFFLMFPVVVLYVENIRRKIYCIKKAIDSIDEQLCYKDSIKKCPVCGHTARLWVDRDDINYDLDSSCKIKCTHCGYNIQSNMLDSIGETIKKWNDIKAFNGDR